ncbi:hypothetical protein E9934_13905 [Nocardioides caeni]|uniref:Big-1 domain-containing protein n=1 Tax=Nocardioides caeni TaxID=574700 RepID=A0A4S8N499_9ACTN|nr:Ig-like domain-containing protein [Nocardioides caeni]THV10818.1 hypothetical protein E9934_13905 [Nocardioides caeni]
MNSSGFKRGLAFSAVSALAVVGLPLAASADSVNEQVDQANDNYEMTLFSFQESPFGSTADDGTVTLEAGATSDFAEVTFQYTLSAGPDNWVDIATVSRNDNGSFKYDWAVPASILDVGIDVRVTGLSTAPGPSPTQITSDPDQRVNSVIVHAASDSDGDDVELREGDEIGVYQRDFTPSVPGPDPDDGHFVAINGVTSASNAAISQVGMVDPDDGQVPGGAASGVSGVDDGVFEGVFDIENDYEYDTHTPIVDEIVITGGVEDNPPGPGTADVMLDVETYELYKQTITQITATPDDPSVPDSQFGTDVTLTVTDQNGEPVAGAVVYRETTASDPSQPDIYVGVTNGLGQVETFPARNDGEVQYFVNATNSQNFDAGLGDKEVRLTIGQYVDGAVDLRDDSTEGDAFDINEYDFGDVAVQVTDLEGDDFNVGGGSEDQNLHYRWVVTPFDGSAPYEDDGVVTGETFGRFSVPLPAVPPGGGTFELFASLDGTAGGGNNAIAEKAIRTFKIGQAEVIYTGFEPQIADVNTTATATGTLQLADGTVLPGRNLALTWTRGLAADGDDPVPDTFLSSASNVTTDANGQFTAQVRDVPDGPESSELGGELSVASSGPDNAAVTGRDHGINFVTDAIPAGATIQIDTDSADYTPGVPVLAGLVLKDSGGNVLKGRRVTITLDRGFFLKANEIPANLTGPLGQLNHLLDPDPQPGEQIKWASAGQSITIATDSTGRAEWAQVVQRDAGFDDDGKVTQTATATGGSASDTEDYAWNTINGDGGLLSDALFISSIEVVKTPAVDQEGPTDPAPVANDVWFDVYAKDGYGNLVKGVTPTVTWVPGPDDHPTPTHGGSSASDFDNGGDLWVHAHEGGVYDFDAVLNYGQTVFDDPVTLGDTIENRDVTDSFSQEWYDAVPSDYSISVSPSATLEPGQVALVTATVLDQEGNPVPGLQVDFVRSGDPNEIRFDTNADGQATYAFTSTTPSVESVTAVVRTPAPSSTVLQTLNTQVTFKNPASGEAQAITAAVRAGTSGNRDIVVFDGPPSAGGALATLYRVVGGRLVKAGAWRLNSQGNKTMPVADRNGNRVTAYRVVVSANSAVKRYVSKIVRTR